MEMNKELIEKAKAAKSAEELLTLAKEYNIEMTLEEAAVYWKQLNPVCGEMSDDELGNVAGGGCETSDGHIVVTSGKQCFMGNEFKHNWYINVAGELCSVRKDNMALRKLWQYSCNNLITQICELDAVCGNCQNLEFNGGTGYCGKT